MTTQHLIIKIQALLGGRVEMSPMQKRAIALEYCRLCSDAEASLEHCIALIRAGREYPALQVAESASLLETINSLYFEECSQWRDYCLSENLPYPARFDDSQIRLLNSIYSKGVTQTHPLYRDYRRAMRMRKYEDALAVIKTIGKINSYDAEVKGEVNRLTRLLVKTKLETLAESMRAGDDESFYKDFDFVETNSDCISDARLWEQVKQYRENRTRQRNEIECKKIISELKNLNAEHDWERIIELVADFNSIRAEENFSEQDLQTMDNLWQQASKIQEERLNLQHQAEARTRLAAELEKPTEQSKRKELALILKLKRESANTFDSVMSERVDKTVSELSRSVAFEKYSKVFAALCVLALICWVAFSGWGMWKNYEKTSFAKERIAAMEKLKDFSQTKKSLDAFFADFPELSKKTPFAERLAVVDEDLKQRSAQSEKLKNVISSISALDIFNASTAQIVSAAESLEKAASTLSQMNTSDAVAFSEPFEKCSSKFKADINERKKSVSAKRENLLEKFEKLAGDYELSPIGETSVRSQLEALLGELNPLMADTARFFAPSDIETGKYAEISAKIKALRVAREKYAALLIDLSSAKNLTDYMAAAESINAIGDNIPQKYISPISNILKNRGALKNLFAFGIKNLNLPLDEISQDPFSKSVFTQNKLLTDVFKYMKTSSSVQGAKEVYTRGPVGEQTNKWSGGSEIMQQADEIGLGGTVSKTLFRMQSFKGGASRGETLVGGALSAESKAGRAALHTASEKSTLAALRQIQTAQVNPIYKLLVENAIFAKLAEDPVGSGLAYSPSANKRKAAVEEAAAKFFPYSWIFEGNSKKQLVKGQLYSEKEYPDYEAEALAMRAAIAKLKAMPPKFGGVANSNGKFSGQKGANIIAFSSDGSLQRFLSHDENTDVFAPYSPVFIEQMSIESVLKASNE